MMMNHESDYGNDQVYIADRWSKFQWSRHCEIHSDSAAAVEQGREKLYSFPRFGREVFARLFGDDLAMVERVRPEDRWAADAHSELSDMPDFERLRRRCRGDRTIAGLAATEFAKMIAEKLPVPPAPLRDPEPLRDQVRGLFAFARSLSAEGDDAGEMDAQIAELQRQGKEAVRMAIEQAEAIDPSDLRRLLRAACKAADARAAQVDEQVGAFCGWGEGGAGVQGVGVEVKAQLARCLGKSAKLKALAMEAGRLRRIASAKQRSKVDHAHEEVLDLELGADVGRVLASDLVKLGDPVFALEFARRLCERGLQQYKLGGKEAQGRGPIVICIDQSSSMEGAREVWSKGLALALLQVAAMQKRRCVVIHFNDGVAAVDVWVPGKVDPLALIQSLEPFYGGGTSFEKPLRRALEAIETDVHLKKADVVLVTDGEAEVSSDFLAEWTAARKRLEITCYAVHISAVVGPPAQLSAVADTIVSLADVANDRAVSDAVLGI